MVYLIVDNRGPEEVEHWLAFAQWWSSRRTLVGPQQEKTDILWIQANHVNGLHVVPYYWAGVFALEAARFLFPKVHFGLIDNDCVPVTLFEVQDLVALAESQFRWPDVAGHYTDPDLARSKLGMLLFTEAHLEYNAGLVISIGSTGRPSPVETTSTADCLAEELADYRHQLLAMATPPECPTDASQGGSLLGVPMENSLDLAVVWALYGTSMCHNFWPMPCSGNTVNRGDVEPTPVKWPKRAHPGALTQAGQERTPWLTSWARATFEQGCLSVLPHLEGPCKAMSLPGDKHLFQASRIVPDRMRPIIFHAFGKAKLDAPLQLDRFAHQGWETLPIALPVALAGNSAFRFCLMLQWHAIAILPSALFPNVCGEHDTDVVSAHTLSEPDQDFLERTLLTAATDQNSRESGSSLPERLPAEELPEQFAISHAGALCAMAGGCSAHGHSCGA